MRSLWQACSWIVIVGLFGVLGGVGGCFFGGSQGGLDGMQVGLLLGGTVGLVLGVFVWRMLQPRGGPGGPPQGGEPPRDGGPDD